MSAVDALQTALAAEHAAVHVYGVLGGRAPESATALRSALVDAYTAHRSRRDRLVTMVRDEGAEPVAAEPAYDVPPGTGGVRGITEAALGLERATATTYAWLVGNVTGTARRWAVGVLTSTAVRELTFRGSPEIFPGAGELTDREAWSTRPSA